MHKENQPILRVIYDINIIG